MTIIGSMFHEELVQVLNSGARHGELSLRLEPDGEVTAFLVWDKEASRTEYVSLKVRLPDGKQPSPFGLQTLNRDGEFLVGRGFVPDCAGFTSSEWMFLEYRGCYQWDVTDGNVFEYLPEETEKTTCER